MTVRRNVFFAGLGVVMMAGLQPATAAPVTLHALMEDVPETHIIEAMLPEFEKETGIKVEFQKVNYGDMHDKLATQLVSGLRQAFQLEFPLRHIFESPTVAGLAGLLPRYETKPGQVAAIARLRQQIKRMSPEQIQAMLREKQKASSGR